MSGTDDPEPDEAPQVDDSDFVENRVPGTLSGKPADNTRVALGSSLQPAAPDIPIRRGRVLNPKRHTRALNSLRHELTVIVIVIIFLLALALMLLVAFIKEPETQAAIREIGTLVFPPLVTLAGTSFAWFFATKDREPKE